MPHRVLVAKQLSELFSVLAHPVRLQIVVELRNGELCVNSLQDILGVRQSAVSQHLALLKAHHLIKERRHGRQVLYRLTSPEIAPWIVQGIPLILPDASDSRLLKSAAQRVVDLWSKTTESENIQQQGNQDEVLEETEEEQLEERLMSLVKSL
ncbi:MAG: metalloregulator ArsR/SmtB family transcription factor [Candidatus Obscuribacterales bacterium]|nr:winged helix-turn-helix transcriptional regulator [Cyanobacteria bacterium SZAS LIN-5]